MRRKLNRRRSRTDGAFLEARSKRRSINQLGIFSLAALAASCATEPRLPEPKPGAPVQMISAADAARIKYSKQQFAYLDIGETTEFSGDRIKGWPQGGETGPIRLDFGDGTALQSYEPFSEVKHCYAEPGTYLVTASAEKDGRPAMTKLKAAVEKIK